MFNKAQGARALGKNSDRVESISYPACRILFRNSMHESRIASLSNGRYVTIRPPGFQGLFSKIARCPPGTRAAPITSSAPCPCDGDI